jgi:acyl dehydratase
MPTAQAARGDAAFAMWFDDLEQGLTYTSRARTITETDIVQFSANTGDRHPVHIDAQWAASSPFGERIAHGLLVLSYAAGMLPLDPERVIAMRSIDGVRFKRPVTIGDTIHVEGKLKELKELDDQTGLVVCQMGIVNQDGRRVSQAEIGLLWRRESTAGAIDNTEEA